MTKLTVPAIVGSFLHQSSIEGAFCSVARVGGTMGVTLVRKLLTAGTVAGGLLAMSSGAAVASVASHHPGPNHKVSHSTSLNWSGYAVGGSGPYKSVSSTWRQPAVNCAKTPTGWSSFWVGLDGDTTNTVEQTGTEADCSSGTTVYYAWYEMYPKYPLPVFESGIAG